jgi:hypothetical protein
VAYKQTNGGRRAMRKLTVAALIGAFALGAFVGIGAMVIVSGNAEVEPSAKTTIAFPTQTLQNANGRGSVRPVTGVQSHARDAGIASIVVGPGDPAMVETYGSPSAVKQCPGGFDRALFESLAPLAVRPVC